MFNKRGQAGGMEEMSGVTIIEFIGLLFVIAIIGNVVYNVFFDESIDTESFSSFNRLDGVIRERAVYVGSEDVVPIKLDSDYAFVLFNEGQNNCESLRIVKPERKCKGKACLCVCEIEAQGEMCAVGGSQCLTYPFEFNEECGYFKGKSSADTLNVMNVNGSISVSSA